MSSYLIEIHNFLTSPLADFFISQQNCPLSVRFGNYFYDYFYILFVFLLFGWSLFYYVFKKVTQRFLCRVGLSLQRARRASAALWAAGASLGAVLLSASQLETSPWGFSDVAGPTDNLPPPHLCLYLTVLAACLSQRLIAGCFRRGFTRQTFTDLAQISFLPAAYIARWLDIAFCVMTVISIVQTICELARMGISLRKGRHDNTFSFFIIYCVVWCFAYLVSLPAWIVTIAITPMESQQHQIGIALLFASLAAHIIGSLTFSPLIPAFKGCFSNRPTAEWLQLALFPGTDQAMLRIRKQVQEKRDSMEAISRKNSIIKPRKQEQNAHQLPDEIRPKNDAKALMQTVRCVTLLKRKIRSMREKKAQLAALDTSTKEENQF